MTDAGEIVVGNIQTCMRELKSLVNYNRPVVPSNDESLWEIFKDKMRETVVCFEAFRQNMETEKLRGAQSCLEEADTKLKAWAGRSAVLYNPTRGDLAPVLLYCKQVIVWLLEHLSEVSVGSVAADVVEQHARMPAMVEMRALLGRLDALK